LQYLLTLREQKLSPKATLPTQILAPLFVILKKFLHHFCQCTLVQLKKKHIQVKSRF